MAYSIIQKSQLEGALRLDAEYYQPEYLELVKNLNKLGAVPIRDVATNPKRKFKPQKDKVFQYIEISEVDLSTGEYNKREILGEDAPDRAQWVVKQNDVITSTVRPIRSATSLIREDTQNLVCSSGFAVLRTEKVEPEYLFVYLKSRPIVRLLDRKTTATMYPAVTIDDILISRTGTLGSAIYIDKRLAGSIFGSYFIKVIPTHIDLDNQYVALFINSKIGKLQTERWASGGIQTNLTINAIKSIHIPILPQSIQQKISSLIQESFKLRREAKELIDRAKKEVEKMVVGN